MNREASRWAEAVVPICVLAALGYWSLRERQFILVDDSYIAFRYAANFADGHGLVWNPGEHVEGYTNLLWVLMLSAFAKFGVDLTWPSLIGSFLFASGCIVVTARLASRSDASSRLPRMFAPLALATNASFVNAATSGMESTAFAFFVLVAIDWLIRARGRPSLFVRSAIAFCAACLTRPEGVLVAATALGTELAASPQPLRTRLKHLGLVGGAVAVVVSAHMAVRLRYYGYPFPNTFYAKVIFDEWTVVRGIFHWLGFAVAGGFLALPGIVELRRQSPLRPWFICGYSVLGVYSAYLVAIGGDHPHWYRFYVPLLPLPLVASGQLLGRILERRLARFTVRASRVAAIASSLVTLGIAGVLGRAFGERQEFSIGFMTPGQRDIVMNIASFFRREVPPGSFVAVQAVGHVGYYSRSLRILDMWGLNDVHIAHRDLPPTAKFGHDKHDLFYVARLKPDYVYAGVPWPTPVIEGYDLCWPSRYFLIAIYRRHFALAKEELRLGVPPPLERRAEAPPPCLPP